ncbi:hypothetical protein GGD46_004261 [Rhizobium lusitanum]|uniref:Uncharacterized protein n=1 Tax=Rhizobium lusitanum TaxID=293958 RepID=A0A7X0IVX4_9HYPH|nr:hypothetical protein [Rhizobium lusitanum]
MIHIQENQRLNMLSADNMPKAAEFAGKPVKGSEP